MVVYLVPADWSHYELYSEAPEEPDDLPTARDGFARRWTRKAAGEWRRMVEGAGKGGPRGRFARWRDQMIHHLAESIAEQRTLWALRHVEAATVRFPSTLGAADARAALDKILLHARRHHGRWLAIDLVITCITGPLFFFVPGPNVLSWYFAFRVLGHLQSWRGARKATTQIAFTLEANEGLAELGALVDVPRAARADQVAAIAARLNLTRLSAFFDRVAVRS
jgi:hypothetical protein